MASEPEARIMPEWTKDDEFYEDDEPVENVIAAFEAAEKHLTEKPKRQVSYNQDAVLCPVCKKRIRLNNSGLVRVHIIGKMGSDECPGSDANPRKSTSFADVENQIANDLKSEEPFYKEEPDGVNLFSDLQ